MVVFFCPTKYALINCLHIKQTYCSADKAILFLYDQGNILREMAERLSKEKIFEEIIFVPTTRNVGAVARWIYTLMDLLAFDAKYKRMLSEMDCSAIYTHGNNFALDVIHKNLVKKNPDLQWLIYEEGLGSYTNDPDNDYSKKSAMFLKLFSLTKPKRNRKIMLYAPELDCMERSYPREKLLKINTEDSDFVELCKNIFGYTDAKYDYDVIYFAQVFHDYLHPDEKESAMINLERELLLSTKSELGQDIAVKPHPRDREERDYCQVVNDYNLFEMTLLNHDFSEKTFITVNSTAAITPKIIFSQEPRVIVLNILFKDFVFPHEYDYCLQTFNKVKALYSDPSRFFIPETKEELIEYVSALNQHNQSSQ